MFKWICFTFLLLHLLSVNALTLQVEPKTEECFMQHIDQGNDVTILYSVTRGGLLDVDVRVCCLLELFEVFMLWIKLIYIFNQDI